MIHHFLGVHPLHTHLHLHCGDRFASPNCTLSYPPYATHNSVLLKSVNRNQNDSVVYRRR
jgi:hypothetical protein